MIFVALLYIYSILSMSRHSRIALHVRDVGGLGICIMGDQFSVFVPEIAGNEPQDSAGHVAAFLSLFLPLEVFGDDDS